MQIGIKAGQQSYTKREALKDLMDAENDKDQAVDSFKMITDSLAPEESLKEATQGFLKLLKTVGNQETEVAQAAYRQVDSRVKAGESRTEGTNTFIDLIRNENNLEDPPGNFDTVGRAVERGFARTESTQEFNILLDDLGSSETNRARSGYSMIVGSLRADEPLTSGTSSYRRVLRAENNLDDIEPGYRLVDESLRDGESRESATDNYLSLIQTFGNRETGTAQKAYQTVHQRVLAGEDRTATVQEFIQGVRAENNNQDPFTNFDLISQAVDRGMDRASTTDQYHSLLNSMGQDKTGEAQTHFKMVMDSLKKEEPLADGLASHLGILRSENNFEDVVSGYGLVNSVVSDEVSRGEATDYYLSLIAEYGNGNTGKAQQAFRETAGLILG